MPPAWDYSDIPYQWYPIYNWRGHILRDFQTPFLPKLSFWPFSICDIRGGIFRAPDWQRLQDRPAVNLASPSNQRHIIFCSQELTNPQDGYLDLLKEHTLRPLRSIMIINSCVRVGYNSFMKWIYTANSIVGANNINFVAELCKLWCKHQIWHSDFHG